MMTPTIEHLWNELKVGGGSGQRRVDAAHPHDIYADHTPPDLIGLVVVCATRPPDLQPLRSLRIDSGRRTDGRWALHITLLEPSLRTVFAALCMDIAEATRAGVDDQRLAAAVLHRIERWRALLLRDRAGLDDTVLRGLLGELHVLEMRVLPGMPPREAVMAWTGPHGTPQDFQLGTGERLEVKALAPNATHVRINGLTQLDGGANPLTLVVVRMQTTGVAAPGRTTAADKVAHVRSLLAEDAGALVAFDDALAAMGWHHHPAHDEYAVHLLGIDEYTVTGPFPRLTVEKVPRGVVDADYIIELPAVGAAQ
jgi:Putative  PD-(D/E)XK family member, (DUF4420)